MTKANAFLNEAYSLSRDLNNLLKSGSSEYLESQLKDLIDQITEGELSPKSIISELDYTEENLDDILSEIHKDMLAEVNKSLLITEIPELVAKKVDSLKPAYSLIYQLTYLINLAKKAILLGIKS